MYKVLLQFAGALAGTLAASLVAFVTFAKPSAYAATIFFVLFLGMWLRQFNYAYWAACATLIFALPLGPHGSGTLDVFAERVAGIGAGALCALGATWFVYPVHTRHVVRRRVADALAAVASLRYHAAQLHRLAPPVRLHRAIFGDKSDDGHPATGAAAARERLAVAKPKQRVAHGSARGRSRYRSSCCAVPDG